jgi:hypothetical protein
MALFALGMLAGGLLTILLLVVTIRIMGRAQVLPGTAPRDGFPELTVSLSRDLLQRLVDDSLRDVAIPLVTLRDPNIVLEPDGVLVIRMRGDTVLLGAQPISLRMRLVPATSVVQVKTESADVGFLGDIAGPLTDRLDDEINAELARRLAFAEQFEILDVSGTAQEVVVQALMRDQ